MAKWSDFEPGEGVFWTLSSCWEDGVIVRRELPAIVVRVTPHGVVIRPGWVDKPLGRARLVKYGLRKWG